MSFIKSVFISLMPMLLMIVIGFAIYYSVVTGLGILAIAALLTTLPIMVFIMWLVVFKSHPRTSASLPVFTVITICGMVLACLTYFTHQTESNLNYVLIILLAGVSALVYIFWYSSLGRQQSSVLSIGKILPDFILYDDLGGSINKQQLLGQQCIFIFYRGNWCPFCVAQIKELVGHYKQLDTMGVKVILVSPQSETKTKKLAKKFDVPFLFLIDNNSCAATILGINHNFGLPMGMQVLGYESQTVYPTVIVVDAQGKILYTDQNNNYRIRPEPEEYIKLLQRHV